LPGKSFGAENVNTNSLSSRKEHKANVSEESSPENFRAKYGLKTLRD
jgi:hypothetical protein